MKFENIRVFNFENAFRGMRNPKESYHLSDSKFIAGGEFSVEDDISVVAEAWAKEQTKDLTDNEKAIQYPKYYQDAINYLIKNGHIRKGETVVDRVYIGPKDMKLAQQLIKAGSEHRKFMREIMVSMDITAPLFFLKEFDTYKVGTVANSTSTMHKLATTPITIDCFETDDMVSIEEIDQYNISDNGHFLYTFDDAASQPFEFIDFLEDLRQKYLETKDKRYWKELIRWLPESWLQTRTVTLTYENLYAMCGRGQRRFHKLNEWSGIDDNTLPNFISMARTLPYAQDLIFLDEKENENE